MLPKAPPRRAGKRHWQQGSAGGRRRRRSREELETRNTTHQVAYEVVSSPEFRARNPDEEAGNQPWVGG
ncbi:hypothetical protein ZHAS_00014005 [Anopheles sinensis]|uniref:Uncharacterized protein n=1 Tax=Anopheles sinensis TaxID=74873 RepID=A0A084W740_ANOSI|nr:hypothetical protein ZHAS_00014005 [Anopheles sinensis]